MAARIYPIQTGFTVNYLIGGDGGAVLIDGGVPNSLPVFRKGFAKAGIEPAQVRLIVVTHGHWDHTGSVKAVKDFTGAPVAMHGLEKDWLEKSLMFMPPGVTPFGRFLSRFFRLFLPLVNVPAAPVDVVLGGEDFPLSDHGIPGRVLYTPGHTLGSVSVLLETGEAFVGDLAMNRFPMTLRPGFPIFAEDMAKVRESWRLLLEQGVRLVYPSHGKSFPADVMAGLVR
ncbi:MAG: MBL fold metallo-hydrolase [Deltaproteobacteria bacterium]|nr:MBL fold metallo-hydrolase [Deltaproteobacteria bacterium]